MKKTGKKVVYVNIFDISMMMDWEISAPKSVYTKAFNKPTLLTPETEFELVRFEEPNEVKFFEETEFILDYDKFKNANRKDIAKMKKEYNSRIRVMKREYLGLPTREIKSSTLYKESENLIRTVTMIQFYFDDADTKKYLKYPDFVSKKLFIN